MVYYTVYTTTSMSLPKEGEREREGGGERKKERTVVLLRFCSASPPLESKIGTVACEVSCSQATEWILPVAPNTHQKV